MSIMVTGGNGFIGWRIIRKLLDAGEEVVCFDLSPIKSNLEPLKDQISFYKGDVTQLSQILAAIKTHDVKKIIHMAALLPPDTEDRPQHGMHVNIDGTNNIFEAARWTDIERVVYASSIAVYGVQETFGERPLTEEDLNDPINVYGFTKSANDFAARTYIQKFGLDLKSVRISTVFGHGSGEDGFGQSMQFIWSRWNPMNRHKNIKFVIKVSFCGTSMLPSNAPRP